MIPFLLAAAALTGRTWDPPRHREPVYTPDRRGCLPLFVNCYCPACDPDGDDLDDGYPARAHNLFYRAPVAPKGKRLTRAQRKALKAKETP